MRFVALLAGALLAAATAAGCSSPQPESSPEAAAATSYLECLRKEGIELPGGGARASGQPFARPSGQPGAFPSGRPTAFPSGRPTAFPSGRLGGFPGGGFGDQPPAGVDAGKWQAATAKCESLRPSGGPRASSGATGRFQAYINCLSEHGVTWTPGQQPASSDPKFAEADKICAVLRPSAPTR